MLNVPLCGGRPAVTLIAAVADNPMLWFQGKWGEGKRRGVTDSEHLFVAVSLNVYEWLASRTSGARTRVS